MTPSRAGTCGCLRASGRWLRLLAGHGGCRTHSVHPADPHVAEGIDPTADVAGRRFRRRLALDIVLVLLEEPGLRFVFPTDLTPLPSGINIQPFDPLTDARQRSNRHGDLLGDWHSGNSPTHAARISWLRSTVHRRTIPVGDALPKGRISENNPEIVPWPRSSQRFGSLSGVNVTRPTSNFERIGRA